MALLRTFRILLTCKPMWFIIIDLTCRLALQTVPNNMPSISSHDFHSGASITLLFDMCSTQSLHSPLIHDTTSHAGTPLGGHTEGSLLSIGWFGHFSIFAVEKHSHLFQTVSTSFWVEEVNSHDHGDKDCHKDNVVFPTNSSQGDGIDEDVEEDGQDGRDESDGQPTAAQPVWPDLDRVGNQERCAVPILALLLEFLDAEKTYSAMS